MKIIVSIKQVPDRDVPVRDALAASETPPQLLDIAQLIARNLPSATSIEN
jgi:hypothetical protein